MNTPTRRSIYLCLLLLPIFMMACSFTVSVDMGEKKATATAAATAVATAAATDALPSDPTVVFYTPTPDPHVPVDITPTRPPALPKGFRPAGVNVALDKPVIGRAGGITYPDWGNANDGADFGTTTQAEKGRWGMNTNGGDGSYEIVDLGREYILTGVGYSLDWDGAFANALTFQVLASTDNENWTLVTSTVHPYAGDHIGNHVDVDFAVDPVRARYVKYWEPADGAWNGWGDFFQLRAYAEE